MGIVLKAIIQPFISLFSIFKLFHINKFIGIDLTEDDCVMFNKVYYYTVKNEDLEKQKEFALNGNKYLLPSWGMVVYPDNKPVKPSTEREMLYSSLGAMRNRDLNVDNTQFEIAAHSVIKNNMAFVDYIPKKPEEIMNFRPGFDMTSEKALALISMLSVLSRSGDLYATELKKTYYSLYKTFVLFPDFSKLEDTLVAYHILHKYENNIILKKWIELVTIVICLIHHKKLSPFGKHIALRIINNDA